MMKRKKGCMADGGIPQERQKLDESIPEWKKSLIDALQAITGKARPTKDVPPTADALADTARRIQDRKRENEQAARYKDGKLPVDPVEAALARSQAKYGTAVPGQEPQQQEQIRPDEKPAEQGGKTVIDHIKNRNDQLENVMDYEKARKLAGGGVAGVLRGGNSSFGDRPIGSAPSIQGVASPASVAEFQSSVPAMAVGTGITPPSMVPTEAQGMAASGFLVGGGGGSFAEDGQALPTAPAAPGNVVTNQQAGNVFSPPGGAQTMAEKSLAAGIDPNAVYRPGSAQDPHASGISVPTAAQRASGASATAAALAPNQQVPQIANPLEMISARQQRQMTGTRGLADGGMARYRFEGNGGPREDKIPVTVAGEKIKVSDGEEAVILPAKTAKSPQAIAQIADVIQQSNDGRPPAMGMAHGGRYAGGAMPHIVDPSGQVYINGRPAGYLPPPPDPVRTNFTVDSSGTARGANLPGTAVGPYRGPGTAVAQYVPSAQPRPYDVPKAAPRGMAFEAGKAAGSAYKNVGGMSGAVGKLANIAVPAVAAAQTFGENGIRVEGNRAADPNYDETAGFPRVASTLKEAALRAGDWGTKGLDVLGGWALPSGEASFNDAYRQGVGQLEGVSAPTSQQVAAKERATQSGLAQAATYSNEGRQSAILSSNTTPEPQIAQTTGNANGATFDQATGNLYFTEKGYDPTKQAMAAGTGAITDPKTGRTIMITGAGMPDNPNAPRDRHGNDMTQTMALRDELTRARADNALSNLNAVNPAYHQKGVAQLQAMAGISALDSEAIKRIALQQQQRRDDSTAALLQQKSSGEVANSTAARIAREGLFSAYDSGDKSEINKATLKAIAAGVIKSPVMSDDYHITTDALGNQTRLNKVTGGAETLDRSTNTWKPIGMASQLQEFASEADVRSAQKSGKLKAGQKILVGGRQAVVTDD